MRQTAAACPNACVRKEPTMKNYEFLLFDLDYTLLDFSADMTMAFEKLYYHCGFDKLVPYSTEMLDTYEKHNTVWWGKYERGECEKPVLLVSRFKDFLAETGFGGDPVKMNAEYLGFLESGGIAYPGALKMLATLKKDYKIYVVTNGNAATAKARIKSSGVGEEILGYFVSETIGCAKPDVRYFEYAAANIPNFDKSKSLIIGDSVSSDITGAINFGIDSLWYTGARKERETAPCTYHAESYDEILRLLLK